MAETRCTRLLIGLLLAGGMVSTARAQTVYESNSGKGKVYSDHPLPGSKPVELRPLNVIEAAPAGAVQAKTPARNTTDSDPSGKSGASGKPEPSAPPYRSLAVVFPEAGGSVAANNATFEVRVSIDPPLRIAQGHAFSLRLDGRTVPGRYTSTEMMIPPEFFGDVAPAGAQQHVVEAAVVDAEGRVIFKASPVGFQTRFVTVLQRPHRLPKAEGATPPVAPKSVPKQPAASEPGPAGPQLPDLRTQ